jgi:putative endonuclease
MLLFKLLYVYILKCSDGSYYVGVTNNLERRLEEHNAGLIEDCYTKNRRPVEVVYWEPFSDYNQAFEFETRLKKWSRKKKEALIKGNWDKLKELSICKNETSHKNKP